MAAGPQTSAPPTSERTMLVRIFLPITLLLKMPPRILPLWTRSRRRPTVAPESDWKWEKYDDSRSPGCSVARTIDDGLHFRDQRNWEDIRLVRERGVHEHQALADDSVAAGCGAGD